MKRSEGLARRRASTGEERQTQMALVEGTKTAAAKSVAPRKGTAAKKAAPAKKTAPAKKAAPSKKASPAKKATAGKKAAEPKPAAAPKAEAAPKAPPAPKTTAEVSPRRTAVELATRQREISVSEFFTKNRHLLGFDNPAKALLTTVKEAVDNSLDACEEAGILPDLSISIFELSETRHRVVVEDNGPGIVRNQIPKIFGQLLYGSKFHRLRQSLTADQPVVIERAGRIGRVPIGRLVDEFLDKGEEIRDATDLGIRVPAFDRRTWSYSWRPVSHLIRHRRRNEILEVRTECGKCLQVTGCHSLFTYDAGTQDVREVEGRKLRPGDSVIGPRCLPEPKRIRSINLLDWLTEEDISRRWIYVYAIPFALLSRMHDRATVFHRKDRNGRSRRYYQLEVRGKRADIRDDNWLQCRRKGFLPCWVIKRLGLEQECAGGVLRTYHHGAVCEIPVTWPISARLMRFLGLYVAEGHADRRPAAFTFGVHEQNLVDEVAETARLLGLATTIEPRERNAMRLKVFGGPIDVLLRRWCGHGAKNKRVPSFVFQAGSVMRRHFLEGLYQGDGHKLRTRTTLKLSSASRDLIGDVELLWLLQGIVAMRHGPVRNKGLGRQPSLVWKLDINGRDAATSAGLEEYGAIVDQMAVGSPYTLSELSAMAGARVTRHVTNHLAELDYLEPADDGYIASKKMAALRREIDVVRSFTNSDLCLLRVKEIVPVSGEHPFVYDLAVPGCENFVAGEGPLACHNSRGQQGIGISAAGMYGQLTTGKPILITSRTGPKRPAHHFWIQIDTKRNQPVVVKDEEVEWGGDHGTKVELEIEATYKKGRHSVDGYIEMTALANPHATITYHSPKGEVMRFERVAGTLPREPKEIKPHPHGVELGILMRMLKDTKARNVHSFLTSEFSRVSPKVADEILATAHLDPRSSPGRVHRDSAESLFKTIGAAKIMAPPTNCLSPIGQELILAGLKQQVAADFVTAVTRPPAVYRGNPFQIEVGLAYGGPLPADELCELIRFANRVPLLYQQSACAITRGVLTTSWRSYGLQQAKGALPTAPMILTVHIASAWVPFTSESKEAIASYPEILREIRLGLQECGRRLGAYLRRGAREKAAELKRSYIEKYIPHIGIALKEILKLKDNEEAKVVSTLTDTLERSRKI